MDKIPTFTLEEIQQDEEIPQQVSHVKFVIFDVNLILSNKVNDESLESIDRDVIHKMIEDHHLDFIDGVPIMYFVAQAENPEQAIDWCIDDNPLHCFVDREKSTAIKGVQFDEEACSTAS